MSDLAVAQSGSLRGDLAVDLPEKVADRPSSSIESFDGPRVATGCLDTHGVPALARHPHHSAARSRRATPATPHTSAWKHMPMTVLRGAPSQATGSVYRSSGHPAREHSLMWARWLCGSGSALMGASTHSSYSLARTHHLSRMHAPSSRPLSSIPSMHDPLSPPPFAGRRTLTT